MVHWLDDVAPEFYILFAYSIPIFRFIKSRFSSNYRALAQHNSSLLWIRIMHCFSDKNRSKCAYLSFLPAPLGISTCAISISSELSNTKCSYYCRTSFISFSNVSVDNCATFINGIVIGKSNSRHWTGILTRSSGFINSAKSFIKDLNNNPSIFKIFGKSRTSISLNITLWVVDSVLNFEILRWVATRIS